MLVLIAVVGLAVVYLAVKSPDVNTNPNKETLPPNDNVPMLGNVGNPSPAMSGGSPVASQVFRTKMMVNYGLVGTGAGKFTAAGNVRAFNSAPGTLSTPSQTVSEMGKTLMTQQPPLIVAQSATTADLNTLRTQRNPIKL